MLLKTETVKIDSNKPEAKKIKKAAQILKRGGLVAFATETVYGVGTAFWNTNALRRLYQIKQRPKDKPFSAAIADKKQLLDLGCEVSSYAYRFISKFWPGPLTLVLWTRDEKKIGIRMPEGPVAQALLKEVSTPLALPSANISGNKAPVTATEVLKDLEGKVEMVLDSGKTNIGIESTVLDLTVPPYRILREGAIKKEDIDTVPKKSVLFVCTGNSCRSVMAEGLLRKMLKEKSKTDVEVVSAGIAGMRGAAPTKETINVMKDDGVDVSSFRSKALNRDFIDRSELILVMQDMHKRDVLSYGPETKNKVYLLREFTKDEAIKDGFTPEIPDPIGGSAQIYKRVFDIIKRNIDKLVEMI